MREGWPVFLSSPRSSCSKVAGEADMKRLVANELLRAGAFVEVRSDKMGSARRSRSTAGAPSPHLSVRTGEC